VANFFDNFEELLFQQKKVKRKKKNELVNCWTEKFHRLNNIYCVALVAKYEEIIPKCRQFLELALIMKHRNDKFCVFTSEAKHNVCIKLTILFSTESRFQMLII
jgi:hypothetical protein